MKRPLSDDDARVHITVDPADGQFVLEIYGTVTMIAKSEMAYHSTIAPADVIKHFAYILATVVSDNDRELLETAFQAEAERFTDVYSRVGFKYHKL